VYYDFKEIIRTHKRKHFSGACLQDIDLLRNDEALLDALYAKIIPDPTTAGDFLRQFEEDDIIELMETKNSIRLKIWRRQPSVFRKEAIMPWGRSSIQRLCPLSFSMMPPGMI
jgi:hypothetical protein